MTHHCRYQFHWPKFYRYQVGNPAMLKASWNKYPDHPPIGWGVVVGRYIYCVKWAGLTY